MLEGMSEVLPVVRSEGVCGPHHATLAEENRIDQNQNKTKLSGEAVFETLVFCHLHSPSSTLSFHKTMLALMLALHVLL